MKLEGIAITGDALHYQMETCEIIIRQGEDYLFSLKGNQKELSEAVRLHFEDPQTNKEWEKYIAKPEKGHRRIERRECYKLSNTEWLKSIKNWPGLKTVFAIKTYKEEKDTVSKVNHEKLILDQN